MERNWKNLEERWNGEAVAPKTVLSMKTTQSYEDAKKNGSLDKAVEVVAELVGDGREYRELFLDKEAVLVPVMGEGRTKGKNQLPIALAMKLSELGGQQVNMSVSGTHPKARTGATWLDRVMSPLPKWSGEIQSGRNYIIVDDVITSGITANSLRDWIEGKGGRVTAVTALAVSRYGKRLGVTDEQVERIKELDRDECGGALGTFYNWRYADGFDGMTHHEAKFVIESKNVRKEIALVVEYAGYSIGEKKEREEKGYGAFDWEEALSDPNAKERILNNEERLNAIFSRSAGKREDLLGWMDGDTAKVTVPWFIKAEARDVLKDYTEMLNGRYTNIRFQDANGWKTSALIEFEAGRAKLSPEVCSMIITGAKAEEIVERITRKLGEEKKCEKKEAVRAEKTPGKKKGKGI
jgi:hypothetical protein